MRVTADTNILVRAGVHDDVVQAQVANKLLAEAETVAVPLSCLCEFAWVLRQSFRFSPEDIAFAIRRLVASENVVVDRPAVEAGLAVLDAGGDLADGIIAHEGRKLGGGIFATFDAEAAMLIRKLGHEVRLLR